MAGDGDVFPEGALSDIAYLSRSQSRVNVLATIAKGSYSRSEIEEETEIARTTVGRTINEFEERGWARRTTDGGYTVTPAGKHVIAELRPFVQSMEVIREFGDLLAWLPIDEVPIDLSHFSDAIVHRPDRADPTSTHAEFTTRMEEAAEFQCLVRIAPPIPLERRMRDAVVDRGMDTKHVITDGELNYLLNDPERVERWQEYINAGANVYRYDGEIPCNLFVFDDTVLIGNTSSDFGEPHVVIESDNEEILSWTQRVIEKYRSEAERLDSSAFSVEPGETQRTEQ